MVTSSSAAVAYASCNPNDYSPVGQLEHDSIAIVIAGRFNQVLVLGRGIDGSPLFGWINSARLREVQT